MPDPEREEYGRYGNPTVARGRERGSRRSRDRRRGPRSRVGWRPSPPRSSRSPRPAITWCSSAIATGARGNSCAATLGRFGVTSTLVAPGDFAALAAAMTPETKLVISESPTNPYLSCVDLAALGAVVRRQRGVRSIIDATFATPVNCRPGVVRHRSRGAQRDQVPGGHNDVLAGVVAGPRQLVSLVRDLRHVLGAVCDPHAAFLVGRGLKTLALRVERQNATAMKIAHTLENHPAVAKVFYPGLASHADHAVAKRQMRGFGGVISFVVKGGGDGARRVVDGCKLARIAPSLGGVETLSSSRPS